MESIIPNKRCRIILILPQRCRGSSWQSLRSRFPITFAPGAVTSTSPARPLRKWQHMLTAAQKIQQPGLRSLLNTLYSPFSTRQTVRLPPTRALIKDQGLSSRLRSQITKRYKFNRDATGSVPETEMWPKKRFKKWIPR